MPPDGSCKVGTRSTCPQDAGSLCDVFRSLGTGIPDFILGRKRFGSASAIEIEVLLHGASTPRAVFDTGNWRILPAGCNVPPTLVYDDRFVADNVFVGQFVAIEHRRNLYGLALGSQGSILKEQVDAAERELSTATVALNTTKSVLAPLIPSDFSIETFRSIPRDDAIEQRIGEATRELELAKLTKQNADAIRQRKALIVKLPAVAQINVSIAERQRTAGTVEIALIEKRIVAMNAQKRRHELVVVDAYAAFDTGTATKALKEKAKTAANKAVRDQSEQVLKDYGDRINKLLDLFGVSFRLVSGGVKFAGGPPSGELAVEILGTRVSTSADDAKVPSKPSLANTLSSGDRSALGLAYFIAVAERDPRIGDTVVVLDDPFHSQDRSRRRRTIECIHRVASASLQCFVLSHELDFAREAASHPGLEVNTFTLDPMADHSVFESVSLPPLPSRAYEQDYSKLASYLRSPTLRE